MQMTLPLWQKEELKSLLMKVKEESEKAGLKLKILQARLQQYVNRELPDVRAGFRKGRGNRDQIANICQIFKKARELQKNTYFCFIDYAKATVWTTTNSGKFLRVGSTRPPDLLFEKSVCRSRSNSLELYMEQQTGSKLGKECVKALYCHLAYLIYMQSTSCKMLIWMKHKLEKHQ